MTFSEKEVEKLAKVYLRYIEEAQLPNGRFHNFKDRNGKFLDSERSEDSFGRTVWALGAASKSGIVDQEKVGRLLNKTEQHLGSLHFPRSVAFSLLGMIEAGHHSRVPELVQKLLAYYQNASSDTWSWFEECIRYSNGILPYALLCAGGRKAKGVGLESVRFLNSVSRIDGKPSPIGNKGWYCRDKKRAVYDQQCIDAADMVLANVAAYRKTKDEKYKQESYDWFQWFHGNNLKGLEMVTKDGGCYDGVDEDGVNKNQGAESVLAYLLAVLAMAKSAGRSSRSNL